MESDDELERMLCGGLLTDENGMKPDDCFPIDYMPYLSARITAAAKEVQVCRKVIRSRFSMNPYLHDSYVRAANELQGLLEKWRQRFPGEPAVQPVFLESCTREAAHQGSGKGGKRTAALYPSAEQ